VHWNLGSTSVLRLVACDLRFVVVTCDWCLRRCVRNGSYDEALDLEAFM